MGENNHSKHLVACVGIICVTAIEVANLALKGPDSTVTAAVVGAITLFVGWVLGKKVGSESA